MKKNPVIIILIVMFMATCFQGYSQQWNPKIATWIYESNNLESRGDLRVSYLRDTLVQGHLCQILQKDIIEELFNLDIYSYRVLGQVVTYYESGVTYILNNNHFDTLYYFTGKINERYEVTDMGKWTPDDQVYAVIADTGSVTVNNHQLKWQAVDYHFETRGNQYALRDTIIERIGATKYYFIPWDFIVEMVDGHEGGRLQCYKDSTLGIYSTSNATGCNFDLSRLYPKTYKPYISESKVWKYVQKVWLTGGSGGPNYLVNHVYFRGDTVVENIRYKKLYKKPEQPIAEKEYLAYLMREDNIDQKVYVYDPHYKKEALLYDFKLNKGDEFNIFIVDNLFVKKTVIQVDTISASYLKLKRILFDDTIILVEGIGMITYRIIPSEGELYCVTDHDFVMYTPPGYNNCDTIFPRYSSSINHPNRNNEVLVYPHPVTWSSKLRVYSNNNERLKIEICSYSGALIKEDFFTNEYPIGSLRLAEGLYVYRIFSDQQLIKADKMIVGHP